ncbi:MAG: SprT-like domain-containing protein [Bacteroidales bacterium]|nr:SprT-like domain-containing protein [Bacteroidales bacterium]
MKPTVEYITERFHHFNKLCFGGELAIIPIKLSNAKTFLGKLGFKRRKRLFGKWEYYDFRMFINTRIETSELELEDTILHEMIHYYLYSHQIDDGRPHGMHFRQMMDHINKTYGRHITISHRSSAESLKQIEGTRPSPHIFAIITLKDGKRFIKVVPRIKERVLSFHKMIKRTGKLQSIEWYYSKDPYFNRFPSSVSLRVQFFDEEEMKEHLTTAVHIHCDGKKLELGEDL